MYAHTLQEPSLSTPRTTATGTRLPPHSQLHLSPRTVSYSWHHRLEKALADNRRPVTVS